MCLSADLSVIAECIFICAEPLKCLRCFSIHTNTYETFAFAKDTERVDDHHFLFIQCVCVCTVYVWMALGLGPYQIHTHTRRKKKEKLLAKRQNAASVQVEIYMYR